MSAYISFTNKSLFPLISIYNNGRLIEENIISNTPTKKYRVDSGSVEFTVMNNGKPVQSVWVSLYPNDDYELIIRNYGSCLIKR